MEKQEVQKLIDRELERVAHYIDLAMDEVESRDTPSVAATATDAAVEGESTAGPCCCCCCCC